jgi:hypothetical protein
MTRFRLIVPSVERNRRVIPSVERGIWAGALCSWFFEEWSSPREAVSTTSRLSLRFGKDAGARADEMDRCANPTRLRRSARWRRAQEVAGGKRSAAAGKTPPPYFQVGRGHDFYRPAGAGQPGAAGAGTGGRASLATGYLLTPLPGLNSGGSLEASKEESGGAPLGHGFRGQRRQRAPTQIPRSTLGMKPLVGFSGSFRT